MGTLVAFDQTSSYPFWRAAKAAYAICATSIIAPNSSATWTIGGNGAVISKFDRKTHVHHPMTKGSKCKIRMPDGTILAEVDGSITSKQDRKTYTHVPMTTAGKKQDLEAKRDDPSQLGWSVCDRVQLLESRVPPQ